MDLNVLLSTLKLDTLDNDWVDAVWDNEFMQVEELPVDYMTSEEFDQCLQDFKAGLVKILADSSLDNTKSFKIWDSLGPHVRTLLPIMYYFMKQGSKENEDNNYRLACLNSASLYFVLLSIPGSSAFKVFRRLLYETALESFKLSALLRDETSSKRRSQNDAFDEEDDHSLFYGQKYLLAEGLNCALRDLLSLIKSFSLSDKPDSFEMTVEAVASLTSVDIKVRQLNFSNLVNSDFNPSTHKSLEDLLHSLTYNAYVALQLLASGSLQNNSAPCVELVLDNLLPNLAWGGSEGSTRERTAMRQNVQRFVRNCLLPIAKEASHYEDTMLTLVRHLCGSAVRMSAEIRRLVAGTILEIIGDMPDILPVLNWIIKFSRSEKNNHRLMSVEILGLMLLKSKEIKQLENLLPIIIEGLVARIRDISPTVCGRALSAISECSMLPHALDVIRSSFEKELPQDEDDTSTPLTEGENILIEIMERTSDHRAVVRRFSLQVLANLITVIPFSFRRPILHVLKRHCLDPSSLVRKQVLVSLTSIICTPPPQLDESGDVKAYLEEVEESWLRGVLPQVCDRDLKVREKALELSWNVLLGETRSGGIISPNWHLIHQVEMLRLLPFVSEACSAWAKDINSLGKNLWPGIEQCLEGEQRYPAWLLLSTISEHSELPAAECINNHYKKISQMEEFGIMEECTYILILRVLGRVSIDLPKDAAEQLVTHLSERISNFLLPASVIRPAVDALYLISRHAAGIPSAECGTYVPSWGADIIRVCEEYIASTFQSGVWRRRMIGRGRRRLLGEVPEKSMDQDDEVALTKRMLTLADVALVCPGIVKNSTINTIQSILFPQPLPNGRSRDRSRMPSPKLCSVAVVVLGKLCLQDARLAARIVPALGSLLQQPPVTHPPPSDQAWAPLRNNVMCALSDMCRSFAQLVDPLLPRMSACLHSSDATLKENALVLLVQLLQEDYLKVRRGALLFDLLTALNDKEIAVSQLATYYLGRCLVHSQPSIMCQNILPALFHYNNYQGHEIYKVYGVDSSGHCDGVLNSSSEEEQMHERRNIFRFMLQHITDDQRQKVIGKICREVLGGVVEGTVSLDLDEGCQLLSDAIWILTSEEIRPIGMKNNDEECEEDAATVEETAEEIATAAGPSDMEPPSKKRKTQFPGLQKEMLDVLLPIAVALMQRLEQLESPLLSHLMGFLVHTFKEYKIDVGDLAAGDKKLLDDILRNIKSFERK